MALCFFLDHVRRHAQGAQFLDESGRVVDLVGAQRRSGFVDTAPSHDERRVAFGHAARQCVGGVDHEAVTILHQRMAQIGQSGLVAVAFFVQPRIRIGRRLMRLVAVFLAFEVNCGIAPAVARRRSAAILPGKALNRCPRLDHGAVDGKILVRNDTLLFSDAHHLGEEVLRHRFAAVGAEG